MREPVDLPKAYRLLNHGPTVLVSAAHGGQRNVMAAAWAMALDFEPAKVAVVLDKSTHTRKLIETSGEFALCVPCAAQADLTTTVGSVSGANTDKFAALGLLSFAGKATATPLIEGCVAWLECKLLREPQLQQNYDLFLGEVLAAQADSRVFSQGRWRFDEAPQGMRTLHHQSGGAYWLPGAAVQGRNLLA